MMKTNRIQCIILGFILFLLASCQQADVPFYEPVITKETKTLFLTFIDKSDEYAYAEIYVNNTLVGIDGVITHSIPDSLQGKPLHIEIAEYGVFPKNVLAEVQLSPQEYTSLTGIIFSRENAQSAIQTQKIAISTQEPTPKDGYFKVRFLNLGTEPIQLFRRNAQVIEGYNALALGEERPYQEFPFGYYLFKYKKGNTDGIERTNMLSGSSGKFYTVVIPRSGTPIVIKDKDVGQSTQSYGYIGFINLLPSQTQVTLGVIPQSTRTQAETYAYATSKPVEMIPSGTIQLRITGLSTGELVSDFLLQPWDYVMAFLVEKDGKPYVQYVSYPFSGARYGGYYPLGELSEDLSNVKTRYINFSPDAGEINFVRVSSQTQSGQNLTFPLVASNAYFATPERDLRYNTGLSFGEIAIPDSEIGTSPNVTNGKGVDIPYLSFDLYGGTLQPPLQIQAHQSNGDIYGSGTTLPNTQITYPFYYQTPATDAELPTYESRDDTGEPGVYSIILTGLKSNNSLKTIVLKHSLDF
jgi:hypothetical protein